MSSESSNASEASFEPPGKKGTKQVMKNEDKKLIGKTPSRFDTSQSAIMPLETMQDESAYKNQNDKIPLVGRGNKNKTKNCVIAAMITLIIIIVALIVVLIL